MICGGRRVTDTRVIAFCERNGEYRHHIVKKETAGTCLLEDRVKIVIWRWTDKSATQQPLQPLLLSLLALQADSDSVQQWSG